MRNIYNSASFFLLMNFPVIAATMITFSMIRNVRMVIESFH